MADSHPTRPPLLRGNTVPLYVRTLSSAAGSQQEQGRSQAEMALANGPLSARPEGYKGYASHWQAGQQSGASSSSSSRPAHSWQIGGLPPTPPLSTSPGSAESSYHEEAYFPPMAGYGSGPSSGATPTGPSGRAPSYAYAQLAQQSYAQQQHFYSSTKAKPPSPLSATSSSSGSSMCSPTVSEHPSTAFQLLRSTRGPAAPQTSAKMRIDTTPTEHILSAAIGPGFDSNCITIAARKGNIIDIVADRWDCEKDCHHEWQVQFDRDADMGGIRASYTDGVLKVTVKRIHNAYARPPQMRS